MKLIHDVPSSQGVANALKRARQFTEIQWHPKAYMPACYGLYMPKEDGSIDWTSYRPFHRAWRPQLGLPYSSCRKSERFIGYNVSIETFMTALMNPHSVLYTKNLHGTGGAVSSYYGTVCSATVSHVLNMPYRTICKEWPDLPGITEIDATVPENLMLGDILDDPKSHVAIITDILRDENGKVHFIEVTECTPPFTIRRTYDLEAFAGWWLVRFRAFRYAGIHDVPYTPSPYVRLEGEEEVYPTDFKLMTNWGHKVNVLLEEEPVELTVIKGEWDTFEVTAPDGSVASYPAGEQVPVVCDQVGDYSAVCVKGSEKSEPVIWHVHNLRLTLDKETYKVGEPINLHFENAENDCVFHYIINKVENNGIRIHANVEADASGTITTPGIDAAGEHWACVIAKNEYGCYVSGHVPLTVAE